MKKWKEGFGIFSRMCATLLLSTTHPSEDPREGQWAI